MREGADHPEEDVPGGVEPCAEDARGAWRAPLADDAAGKAGDGALDHGPVLVLSGIGHHQVDGMLGGAADLRGSRHRSWLRKAGSAERGERRR